MPCPADLHYAHPDAQVWIECAMARAEIGYEEFADRFVDAAYNAAALCDAGDDQSAARFVELYEASIAP